MRCYNHITLATMCGHLIHMFSIDLYNRNKNPIKSFQQQSFEAHYLKFIVCICSFTKAQGLVLIFEYKEVLTLMWSKIHVKNNKKVSAYISCSSVFFWADMAAKK